MKMPVGGWDADPCSILKELNTDGKRQVKDYGHICGEVRALEPRAN
jgi:hypothetical protein